MTDLRRFADATARNRAPILAVLEEIVPANARVLEIAAGTGEHAVFLAARLPVVSWQPTDPDPSSRASIDAWRAHVAAEDGAAVVLPALPLDVHATPWPVREADVITCINMVHIAPWTATEALLRNAAQVLPSGGVLYLYGPYRRHGTHTAPSNEAFDASLRARNPAWGIRDLEAVVAEAEAHGLVLDDVVPMPANNFSVVLRRS